MLQFLQHRIADRRVLRQVRQWLKAGVLEEGELSVPEAGTPQGGSVSPLLANIYLHYVLDLWVHRWRQRHALGELIIVRYVDDFVVGFQYREDAERFLSELRERLRRFSLDLPSRENPSDRVRPFRGRESPTTGRRQARGIYLPGVQSPVW